ncbi:MAG: BrnT family toxin [Acidobacteriota bacterium]
MKLRFEWDNRKAAANRRKHRVGFDEASTVFDDALARIFDDVGHSTDEVREIKMGNSILERLLVVSFVLGTGGRYSNHQRAIGDQERA